MKIIAKLNKIALLAIIAVATFSCNNNDPVVNPTPVDNSIAGIASRDPNLSTLVQALTKTGLVSTVSASGSLTVFAPTNAAFSTFLTANGFANLDAVPVDALKEILSNHVVQGTKPSTALVDQSYIKTLAKGWASTTNTLSMFVDKTNGVKINGVSKVTTANILATNGVIHVVDAVIGLPTIVTHAVANPAFKILVKVVTSTVANGNGFGDQSAIATALTTNTTPLTVFAPTDAAFVTATTGTGFAVGASPATVTKVLQYHVVAGNNLAGSLVDNTDITTVATEPASTMFQKLKVFTLGPLGPRLQDKATAPNNISKIIATDVQCTNGVIHAIDKVLQPNL